MTALFAALESIIGSLLAYESVQLAGLYLPFWAKDNAGLYRHVAGLGIAGVAIHVLQ
jgi:hypothetical protein